MSQLLCDADIRTYLHQHVRLAHPGDSALFLDEFPLYGGDVRADLVVVNGRLHGYEIKSARDTLDRLPRQVQAYGAVFDRASIVVSECHLDSARRLVPAWWEVLVAQCVGGGVCFKFDRRGRANPDREALALTALLWRAEAYAILQSLGLDAGMRSASMSEMMDKLAEHVKVQKLGELVRHKLRARGDWLSAARRKRDGETCQQPANRYRYRRNRRSRTLQ